MTGHLGANDPVVHPESFWDEWAANTGRPKDAIKRENAILRQRSIDVLNQAFKDLEKMNEQIANIDISHFQDSAQ